MVGTHSPGRLAPGPRAEYTSLYRQRVFTMAKRAKRPVGGYIIPKKPKLRGLKVLVRPRKSGLSNAHFLQRLAEHMDKVRSGQVLHLKSKAGSVVVMSEDEFESWKETLHLLRSPANASRLLSAIADADAGTFVEHELIEQQ
jgi:antitoxin YefM